MKHPATSGMNRTGLDMSPIDMRDLLEGARHAPPSSEGDETTLAHYRRRDLEEAEPIGTVPMPGTVKGAAKTGLQKLTGSQPEVLLDKLGGRLAFERTGTRLYDALLAKCAVRQDEAESLPLDMLRRFRDEEAEHFAIVWKAIKELGADPTAQTPEADVNGVASSGLLQVVTDPRTSVAQSIHAIHVAELADHDGWELLIKLTGDMGHSSLSAQFQQALLEEERHLALIRELMEKSALSEAGVK